MKALTYDSSKLAEIETALNINTVYYSIIYANRIQNKNKWNFNIK
jgi:hypothetical protein